LLDGSPYCSANWLGKLNRLEKACREKVVVTRLVNYPKELMFFSFAINDGSVELEALKRSLIPLVPEAKDKLHRTSGHSYSINRLIFISRRPIPVASYQCISASDGSISEAHLGEALPLPPSTAAVEASESSDFPDA
jgi:hypothetical protein